MICTSPLLLISQNYIQLYNGYLPIVQYLWPLTLSLHFPHHSLAFKSEITARNVPRFRRTEMVDKLFITKIIPNLIVYIFTINISHIETFKCHSICNRALLV